MLSIGSGGRKVSGLRCSATAMTCKGQGGHALVKVRVVDRRARQKGVWTAVLSHGDDLEGGSLAQLGRGQVGEAGRHLSCSAQPQR